MYYRYPHWKKWCYCLTYNGLNNFTSNYWCLSGIQRLIISDLCCLQVNTKRSPPPWIAFLDLEQLQIAVEPYSWFSLPRSGETIYEYANSFLKYLFSQMIDGALSSLSACNKKKYISHFFSALLWEYCSSDLKQLCCALPMKYTETSACLAAQNK